MTGSSVWFRGFVLGAVVAAAAAGCVRREVVREREVPVERERVREVEVPVERERVREVEVERR